jgi:hypothetical protein
LKLNIIRSLGFRNLLEEFWQQNNWSAESSKSFDLELDANAEVLASFVYFIQSGVLIAPAASMDRLELLKLSVELEMSSLRKLALDNIHQMLTAESAREALVFAKQSGINDLYDLAEEFTNVGVFPAANFRFQFSHSRQSSLSKGDLVNGMDLRSAIVASLSDVSAILASDGMPSTSNPAVRQVGVAATSVTQSIATTSSSSYVSQPPPTVTRDPGGHKQAAPAGYGVELGATTSAAAPRPQPLPGNQKPVKSGGIYSLLLQGEGSDSTDPISKRTAEAKMPGKVMSGSNKPAPKSNVGAKAVAGNKAGHRSSVSGELDSSFDSANDDIVEYSNRMSIVPQKALTQQEKRCVYLYCC